MIAELILNYLPSYFIQFHESSYSCIKFGARLDYQGTVNPQLMELRNY
jgi:hypothetical protein